MPLPPHVLRRRIAPPGRDAEIALLDWGGSGPLALLHHANGFCAATFALVAERLRPRFRVVAMDARGHGDSSRPGGAAAFHWERFAEDVEAVARSLAPEAPGARVALGLGNSFGGTAMLAAAARAPRLFECVVALDPVVFPPELLALPPGERGRGNALAEGARRRRARFGSRAEARAAWAERSFFARWDPRALDLYVEEGLREDGAGGFVLKCDPEVEAAVFEAGGAFDLFALAPRVRARVLVAWSAKGSFPRSVHERLATALPHGSFEAVPAGHLLPMEEPDLAAELVLRFARAAA